MKRLAAAFAPRCGFAFAHPSLPFGGAQRPLDYPMTSHRKHYAKCPNSGMIARITNKIPRISDAYRCKPEAPRDAGPVIAIRNLRIAAACLAFCERGGSVSLKPNLI
jgi:hypothetical protein